MVRQFKGRRRSLPITRRHPRLDIITGRRATDPNAAISLTELAVDGRLAPPRKPRRWRPWAWAAALVLHALVITSCLLTWRIKPLDIPQSPPGISVVFDKGGTTRTTAPPAPLHGPSSPAETPPQAAPPPPQMSQTLPEVNLNLPMQNFAPLPQATAPPRPAPVTRPTRRAPPPPKYTVMNGMSFNNPSPPMPRASPGLNLSLPESDTQAANAPQLTIKGDVGADWNAELNQWVNDHKYYPDSAAEQGQQGDVQIEFNVDRKGNVTGLHMVAGSGSPFLDQAWLGLFEGAALPPFPPGTKANNVTIDATMQYRLLP